MPSNIEIKAILKNRAQVEAVAVQQSDAMRRLTRWFVRHSISEGFAMRTGVVTILCLIGAACLLHGSAMEAQEPQQEQTQAEQHAQQRQYHPPASDGGVREVLESIVIPPIPAEPFTATLDTEWVKYAADGVTITLVNERHIARDGRGRIYEERWILVPKFGKVKSEMNWIQIADPKLRTLYNCSTRRHICELRTYDPADDLTAAAPLKPLSPRAIAADPVTVEDLGTRNIAGIDTIGRRETATIDTGTIGNDQPLTTMKEYWHSQELGLNILSIRSGPMVGKQTFTITELALSEPDPQLFEPPAGYKVTDLRKNPPISW